MDGIISFTEIAISPMTLAAETNVSDAFDQFQAGDQELAVLHKDGDVMGLLTATDTLETVMSELDGSLDQQTLT